MKEKIYFHSKVNMMCIILWVLPTIFHALFGLYCDLQSLDLHLRAALDQIGPGNRHGDLVYEAIHNL